MLDVELLAFEEKLSCVLLLCCCLWFRDELPVDCVVELENRLTHSSQLQVINNNRCIFQKILIRTMICGLDPKNKYIQNAYTNVPMCQKKNQIISLNKNESAH